MRDKPLGAAQRAPGEEGTGPLAFLRPSDLPPWMTGVTSMALQIGRLGEGPDPTPDGRLKRQETRGRIN